MKDTIARTLADLEDLLAGHEVLFAVIGGIAVMIRGEPRFTADIDIVAILETPQALALAKSLGDGPFRPLFPGQSEPDTQGEEGGHGHRGRERGDREGADPEKLGQHGPALPPLSSRTGSRR